MNTKHCYKKGDRVWFDSVPYYVKAIDRTKWTRKSEVMFDFSRVSFEPHPLFDDEPPRSLLWDNLRGRVSDCKRCGNRGFVWWRCPVGYNHEITCPECHGNGGSPS